MKNKNKTLQTSNFSHTMQISTCKYRLNACFLNLGKLSGKK